MVDIVMGSLIILEGILGAYIGYQWGTSQTKLSKYKIDKEFELEKFRWVTPVGKDSKEQ